MVSQAAPGSVFLFAGNDSYSKEKAIDELITAVLGGSARELNCKVFYGADSDASHILDYLATLPFLSPRRVAVVKDFDKLSKESKSLIADYAKKKISKSTCLILDMKDTAALNDYSSGGHVSIRRFSDPTDSELTSWIKHFLSAKGKKIEDDAVAALKELQGQNLLSIASELEKLMLFTEPADCIRMSDVEDVVARSLTASAFDLMDAIERKDIDAAISIVSESMQGGKKHYEIIGLLCWHLKRILKAKMLFTGGASEPQVGATLKIGARYRSEFFRQVKAVDISRIKSRLGILLEADANIKRAKYDPGLVLEFTVIRLCLSGT